MVIFTKKNRRIHMPYYVLHCNCCRPMGWCSHLQDKKIIHLPTGNEEQGKTQKMTSNDHRRTQMTPDVKIGAMNFSKTIWAKTTQDNPKWPLMTSNVQICPRITLFSRSWLPVCSKKLSSLHSLHIALELTLCWECIH